jgi:hypothetical protein
MLGEKWNGGWKEESLIKEMGRVMLRSSLERITEVSLNEDYKFKEGRRKGR